MLQARGGGGSEHEIGGELTENYLLVSDDTRTNDEVIDRGEVSLDCNQVLRARAQ